MGIFLIGLEAGSSELMQWLCDVVNVPGPLNSSFPITCPLSCHVIISRWLPQIQSVFYIPFRKKERKTRMRSYSYRKKNHNFPGDLQWICTYISGQFPMVSLAARESGKVHVLAMHIFTWNKINAMKKEEGIDMWGQPAASAIFLYD